MNNKNFLSNIRSPFLDSPSSDVGSRCRVVADLLPSFCRVNMLKLVSVLVLILTIGSGNVWGQATSQAPADGSTFVVTYYTNSTYYALPNTITGGSTLSSTTVSVNGSGQVTTENPPTWTLEEGTGDNAGKYYLKFTSGNNTYYLYKNGTSSSNKNFAVGTTNKNYWSFATNGTGYTATAVDRGSNRTKIGYENNAFCCSGTAIVLRLLPVAPSGPTITTSSSMTTLTYSEGSPVAQHFTIGGSDLTNTVRVTAPTDYEVCKTENGTYTSYVEFTHTEVNAADKTVYIRLQSGLSAGNIVSRNITVESSGADSKTIAVTGSVPYTITWMANGNLHATTYVAVGSTLALPATNPVPNSCGCTGKAFFGWYGLGTSYKHASNAPSIAAAGDAVSADKTYYAVFADAEEGDPVYTKVTSITAGTYVMVSEKTASTYRYMPNTTSSSTNPTLGSGITMSTTAGVTTLTNAVTDAMLWDISTGETSGYFYVRPHGSTTIGLGTTNSTGGNIRISTTYVNTEWRFTTSASYGWEIYNGSMYLAVYADNAWRNYSNNSTNQNGTFYMFKQSGGTTYSNYVTSCCTPLGTINGSFSRTIFHRIYAFL